MKIVSLLIFVSLLWSCSSLKIKSAKDVEEIKGQAIVYQLPQNQIDIKIELTKTTFVPGPYAQYAKTYLEIDPLQTEASEQWRISDIQMQVVAVPDTAHTYLLMGAIDKISSENLAQLSGNIGTEKNVIVFQNYEQVAPVIPYFNELTLKKLIIEDKKTSYKEVIIDSISKRIPVENIVVRNKNTEEMAKDAAKTLAKIRKRKFRLVAGLNDSFPKKGDIQIMIDELNKKEQYYLELFMGKLFEEKESFSISIIPDEYKKYFLFQFDTKNGIIDNSLVSKGKTVELKLESYSKLEGFDMSSKIKKTEKLLPYRIPEKLFVSVVSEGKELYKNQLNLAQFGRISYFPLSLLKDSNIKIDSVTGALTIE